MSAGGHMSEIDSRKKPEYSANLKRVPNSKPPFTLGEIKKAIPPHCFQRSLLDSFSYAIYDHTIAFIFYYIATNYIYNIHLHLPYYPALSFLAWPVYWIFQGCVWVIAHECGHHAFSDYQWLNDTIGLILHSALLVPYFSWKYNHRRHHSNIGPLDRDEVYVPKHKRQFRWYAKHLYNPPGRVFTLVAQLTIGWPLYLLFNNSGRHYDRFACHYDPYSPIYSDRERLQICISDAAILAVTCRTYSLAAAKGLAWVGCVHGGPLVIVNGFVVLVTYLKHTHPSLPRYDLSEWDLRSPFPSV